MQNDLKYTVRSREIVDLVSGMRNGRITISPYFQRNLVWRDTHKRDFIDTILKGFPFPQIFLTRGPINLETMESSQAVVDGQQRLNAIRDFVDGKMTIDMKTFKDLEARQKEEFLKYEVAVIDFDLDANDPRLKDIFHRLNRTYYSLSAIEKLASEYSASELMLTARALCGEIYSNDDAVGSIDELSDIGSENDEYPRIAGNAFSRDPGIEESTWAWFCSKANGEYTRLIKERNIFTSFEFDRKVPLMFTLNLIGTILGGYYNRNDRVRRYLEDFSNEFPKKELVIARANRAAEYISAMNISEKSMWWSKASFFTVMCEVDNLEDQLLLSPQEAAENLKELENNVPADYALAAREGVGRKAQRELRAKYVRGCLSKKGA